MFADRRAAGAVLGRKLRSYAKRPGVLVLALPRGGVPVAFEIARALHTPLEVLPVRKLGVPGHEELAMGAIAAGVTMLNTEAIERLGIPQEAVAAVAAREERELERRERSYRDDRPMPQLGGRTLILVDDGLATGASMRVAIRAVRHHAPARVIVAVPVAPPDTVHSLKTEADEVVCALTPAQLLSIGRWYKSFDQVDDTEVR
ncbi:MAG: phosphoribosyltransferase, partial [Candidatus Eremiobacteraeota bacterium]|nr:phosphoribosyltransferase [Candidatus Eremiobacteraeota bacterium]